MRCTVAASTPIANNNVAHHAAGLERHIDAITAVAAPELRAVYGVGPDTAATLLTAIGDNPDRICSDAAFAKGKTKNEIMRCVKRYIAREIYHALREPARRTNELIA